MKYFMALALLLGCTQALSQEHIWKIQQQYSVVCNTLEQVRGIVKAAASGGPYESAKLFKHYNKILGDDGNPLCILLQLSSQTPIRSVEEYRNVEAIVNELYDVIIVEVKDRQGKSFFATIGRFVSKGNAI